MKTNYYLQAGQVINNTNDNPPNGLFSLTKWFVKMLRRYHVGYTDDCCTGKASPNGTDETKLPIVYNKTLGKIQYYNDTNQTYTNLTTF